MLNRLLFSHQRPIQLLVAIFGALVGFLLLLGAVQLYFDFSAVINGSSDMSQPQYLVINKEVNLLNTLFGGQKGFSENEIAQLKKIKGVQNAAALTASRFKVSVSMGEGGMKGMPGMSTDFFFEAVPDNFVDVDSDKWQWKEGDPVVPIILPRDYIKLYNFGFAPSQGLPQVTEGIVSLVSFDINITTKDGQHVVHKGKLAGFSERINTILAPQSFIDYANQKYAGISPGTTMPSRIIIQCEGPATTELIDYFTQNGYETSAEALRNSRLNSLLRIGTSIVVAVGSVVILLSLLVFLLYSQLLLSKSSYELQTLIRIGYDYRKLGKKYMKYYSIIYAGIFLFSISILFVVKLYFSAFMAGKGFPLPSGLSVSVVLWGFAFTLMFLGVNAYSIFNGLRKLAK